MIDVEFWQRIAKNWATEDDVLDIPDDMKYEALKVQSIPDEDLALFDEVSNDEIDDILADLGLDDI